MRPTPWLRAASILTLFHAVAHTVGGVFGDFPSGPATVALDAMRSNTFPVMGLTRSFWMFYRGMGLSVTIFLTVDAIVFWLLGNVARNSTTDIRPILAVFLVGYLAFSVNSFIYFFPPPLISELLIAACVGVAIYAAGPKSKLGTEPLH